MLTPISNEEIEAAKACYEAKHDQSLIDRIKSEMSGGLERLIVRLLRGERDESEEADMVSRIKQGMLSTRRENRCGLKRNLKLSDRG